MDEKEKQEYLDGYKEAKKNGESFFPDSLFKDAVVSLLVFILLVALAYFIGAPLEPRADPADTAYTPRPEWYFLFLFQLLKYFPGNLEVVGVVLIPTIAVILLFILPLIDRSPRRHFLNRPVVVGITLLSLVGITWLSLQSVREAPPPAEAALGDQTAVLYAKNCAGCHGATISVKPDTNLHEVIAQGRHEGMPAWSADLTTDQIDSLVGFILSPGGSQLFTQYCSDCHEASELVEGDPLILKNVLEQGPDNPAHAGIEAANWSEALSPEERTALLNFLIAPDGQRLFTIYCASCHGYSVAFSGDEEDLRRIISQGGMHLDMPPWQEQLTDTEIDALASYVVDPASNPEGAQSFENNCANCHGEKVPRVNDISHARETIAAGGAHKTMPVWGKLLTEEQLNALVSYTVSASKGTSLEVGQRLFSDNCALCHGEFGEGGLNPTRPGDIIAPISSSEYLKARDDFSLRSIISQGQPNFGMSPFGSANGGPLDDDEIDAIVAYLRSWEANPPVELPPEISSPQTGLSPDEVYINLCSQCHGLNGEGSIGSRLNDPQFQDSATDQSIFDTIEKGHEKTAMIAWGDILTTEQIQGLVDYIRTLKTSSPAEPTPITSPAPTTLPSPVASPTPTTLPTLVASPTPGSSAVSFSVDVLPIFEAKCNMCHGTMGGWSGTSYQEVMTSGDHSPTVIPADPEGSLLMQKLLGTQATGTVMPPGGKLSEAEIQIIQEWITAGALE